MTSKAFYECQEPEEALKVSRNTHNTLDDQMRERAFKRFLQKNLPSVKGAD